MAFEGKCARPDTRQQAVCLRILQSTYLAVRDILREAAMQVCFSEGGERFAAIGQGGLAAAWRLDAPQFTQSDSGPLARSDWCHQVTEFSAVHA